MIDAAICDGDIVTVRRQDSADHGDVVAALLEDEATVKVLRRQDGQVWLMPRNPAYQPIPGEQAQILGKVVGVLRVLREPRTARPAQSLFPHPTTGGRTVVRRNRASVRTRWTRRRHAGQASAGRPGTEPTTSEGTMPKFLRRRPERQLLDERNRTSAAARALRDAKDALGAAMVQDYKAGKDEEEIVRQVTFPLPNRGPRRPVGALLHPSRLTHDAVSALTPWMELDGPIFVFPHGTRAATISAQWEDENEETRRRRLNGLDEALRAAGIGCRNPQTKRPMAEEDLVSDDPRVLELFFLDAPDLVESVPV